MKRISQIYMKKNSVFLIILIFSGCATASSDLTKIQLRMLEQQNAASLLALEEKKLEIGRSVYETFLRKGPTKHLTVETYENGTIKSIVVYNQDNYLLDPRVPRINDILASSALPALPKDESRWSWKEFYKFGKPLMYLLPIGDALKFFWNKAYK
ncbi:MAG: hypothetical protein GY749_02865 [Desulfobacteraceae bacterium]|nr:hypothetical protein [Desulfobacteraceae bacterium]